MPNKAPPEIHTNVMQDNAIAFITHLCSCCNVHLTQERDGTLAGNSNHRAHSPNAALTVNRGSTSFAALELFHLGCGGNCRSLREHCSPVVNQALKPMRYRIQCGIIHRVLVSASGFGPFPF